MVDITQALKLKKAGANFDDLSNDFILDANSEQTDVFTIEPGFDYFVRSFEHYTSGMQGALYVKLDSRAVLYFGETVAPQLVTKTLDINEWCVGNVEVYIKNSEIYERVIAYSIPILLMPSGPRRREIIRTILGV